MSTLAPMPRSEIGPSPRAEDSWTLHSEARPSLEWLISPVAKEDFFEQYWEKRPLVVKRDQSNYFNSLLSFE